MRRGRRERIKQMQAATSKQTKRKDCSLCLKPIMVPTDAKAVECFDGRAHSYWK